MHHRLLPLLLSLLLGHTLLTAAEPFTVNTGWITDKPEMLTYKTTSGQGEGLYQVTLTKTSAGVEIYLNIIANGFTKTIASSLTSDMRPVRSTSRIHVNGQISMETECRYGSEKLHIITLMKPYNRTMESDLPADGPVMDFSQAPIMSRVLPLKSGASWSFPSVNPQMNTIVPLTVKVTGEDVVRGIDCYTVEMNDFEGTSLQWVEKGGARRIVRIEQTEAKRVSELILP